MKRTLLATTLFALASPVWAQTPPPANADPYANNAAAGTLKFPLAAPAGKDSGAAKTALPGGVNQGAITPGNWKFGPQNQLPSGAKLWNPAKAKLLAGEKVT